MDDDLLFRRRSTSASRRKPATAKPSGGAWWTIPMLCLGLGVIAWCVITPACDGNRKMVLEREKLSRDLGAVENQISVNDGFLKRVTVDPELSERLAQRQLKFVREGTKVLDLPTASPTADQISPFLLTAMPKPAPLAALTARPGLLGRIASDSRLQVDLLGLGLLLLAGGLVLGGSTARRA